MSLPLGCARPIEQVCAYSLLAATRFFALPINDRIKEGRAYMSPVIRKANAVHRQSAGADAGELDHLAPFFSLVGDQLAEAIRRTAQ